MVYTLDRLRAAAVDLAAGSHMLTEAQKPWGPAKPTTYVEFAARSEAIAEL
ncbi:hypothetical protein [Nocardia sp. NPDC049707]|uniref:hypothetical protein n=1 Tax=Nocardia sp. NPDC049707 TaxID=3154735 RepID=UPI003425D15F